MDLAETGAGHAGFSGRCLDNTNGTDDNEPWLLDDDDGSDFHEDDALAEALQNRLVDEVVSLEAELGIARSQPEGRRSRFRSQPELAAAEEALALRKAQLEVISSDLNKPMMGMEVAPHLVVSGDLESRQEEELEATTAELNNVVEGTSQMELSASKAESERAHWRLRALTIGSTAGLALAAIGANLARGNR